MPEPSDLVACGARPLSHEDLNILALENESVAGHTCKVIVLERELDVDALRDSIGARIGRAPEFSARLREIDGELWWVPAEKVDLSAHVVRIGDAQEYGQADLEEKVARIFETRLDRARPLWRIDVIPRVADAGSVLIWRIHHALADGATAMRMANTVVWDDDSRATPAGLRHAGGPHRAAATHHHHLEGLRAAAREAPQPWLRSPFNGHIGARRSVAFTSVELETLRLVAHHCDGATVNDAVLTVVSGGLRRWLEAHHGHLGSVRVKVPVSLHGAADTDDGHDPGNRDSFFCVDLPLSTRDPIERLSEIRHATKVRKQGHDAQQLDALMRELASVPRLGRFAQRVLTHPRSFALNVSNVPGPRNPVRVLGARVRALYSLAEIRDHHALRVAVVSLADSLNFGLAADPTLVNDVDQMAREMRAEAAELASRLQPV